ncbi:MAG TPA: NfeD family protein [Vicinamibacteria bacterium]|nr:NfeD family protein [Vicinamibacteria bacterium]
MWLVYLLAAILGGGLLLVQILSGGGKDLDAGALGDHPDGPGLLSTRALVYGLFAFGFVGGALHVPGLLRPTGALLVALLAGAVTTLAVGYVLRALGHPLAAGTGDLSEAIGRTARVLVPVAPQQRGKVRVQLKGHAVDMLATTDGAAIPAGADVVVAEIRGDVAHVRAAGVQEGRA